MGRAGEQAQRQADQAAERVREAQARLDSAERTHQAWSAGAEGERQTAAELSRLQADGWRMVHDVHWPGRRFANIDHIAIGPGGIVVIDAKNWTGRVDVSQGSLRQNGFRRDRECTAAAEAASAVAAWLQPPHRALVVPMLCLVAQPTPRDQPAQVRVVGLAQLVDTLRALPHSLSADEVAEVAAHLEQLLDGQRSPAQLSTSALKVPAPRAPREDSYAVRPAKARRQPNRPTAAAGVTAKRQVVALALVAVVALVGARWVQGLATDLAPPRPSTRPSTGPSTGTSGTHTAPAPSPKASPVEKKRVQPRSTAPTG